MYKQRLNLLSISFIVSLFTGCGDSDRDHNHIGAPDDYAPELRRFTIIDSYSTHSDFDPLTPLAVSPYVSFGAFDIIWNIDSNVNYYVNFRMNTVPSLIGSQLITANYCGPSYPCHLEQNLYCEYKLNFDVQCESPSGDSHSSNIDYLITSIPKTLYFILDFCDIYGDYCQYQAIPVVME